MKTNEHQDLIELQRRFVDMVSRADTQALAAMGSIIAAELATRSNAKAPGNQFVPPHITEEE